MSRVVHFEIMANEPQKAIDFYSSALGWKFHKNETPGTDYWLVSTGDEQVPGINGGLASGEPVGAVMNTIGVAGLVAALERVEQNGGRVIQPCVTKPGMGLYATFEDPVGNQFGLLQAETALGTCPDPAETDNMQQSHPGCSDDDAQPEPEAVRPTGTKAARRTSRTPRPAAARTSRAGTRSRRPRT